MVCTIACMLIMVVHLMINIAGLKEDFKDPIAFGLKWFCNVLYIVLMIVNLKWDKRALAIL